MKKRATIERNTLEKLKEAVLASKSFNYQDIADESNVSLRSVNYFFSGTSYNATIHKAALRLLNREHHTDMQRVVERQKVLAEVI